MDLLKFDEAKLIWKQISQHAEEIQLPTSFELEVYKTLLARFHVGAYYYYIFNLSTIEIEFVSPEIETVLGYSPNSFSPKMVFNNLHPEDQERFVNFEKEVASFFSTIEADEILNYKVSYDYRLRCADNTYKWILQQISIIQSNENGAILRTLGVHTDITHLKTDDKPSGLSIIGLDGNPSYLNIHHPEEDTTCPNAIFTKREREILQLILSGKRTSQIATLLSLSPQTISTHRKNILRKSGCATFFEIGQRNLQKKKKLI